MCFPTKRFAPPLSVGDTGNEPGLLYARSPLPSADAGNLPPQPPVPAQPLDDRQRRFREDGGGRFERGELFRGGQQFDWEDFQRRFGNPVGGGPPGRRRLFDF